MNRIKVGIIGTGNIGTDLLYKIQKSDYLECSVFAGHNKESKGIQNAKGLGVNTTYNSIDYFIENPDCCNIVFDATSADAHKMHAPILKKLQKFVLDLTPARVGKMCCPVLNENDILDCDNVNLITCGGQASVPIAYAIKRADNSVKYIEVVASIASLSAGIGTRNNIDEFTQTTSDALREFTGTMHTKAIIILNPALPPITMTNTIYAIIDNPNMDAIKNSVFEMEKNIQKYVPGYKVIVGPVYESGRVTTIVQVVGAGDYLPKYAGNLDIITCAAVEIAENYVKRKILNV